MSAANQQLPPPPLEGAARMWGTIALSAATFMNVLDTSIANVSLPAIAGDLGVSPSQGTWIITSFGVATAISLPLTGWLVQRLGTVRLFAASVLLFTTASWLCGLAWSIESLDVGADAAVQRVIRAHLKSDVSHRESAVAVGRSLVER